VPDDIAFSGDRKRVLCIAGSGGTGPDIEDEGLAERLPMNLSGEAGSGGEVGRRSDATMESEQRPRSDPERARPSRIP